MRTCSTLEGLESFPVPLAPTVAMSNDEQLSAETESSTDDLQRRLEEAEQRVAAQNKVVQELTERLELTAEQLDRLQRMGVERGEHVRGFPKTVVDEQAELVQEMSRVVAVYDDARSAESTASLQMQVEELRDYLEEQFRLWKEKQEADEAADSDDEDEHDTESDSTEESAEEQTVTPEISYAADEPIPVADPPEIVDVHVADEELLRLLIDAQNKFIDYITAHVDRLKTYATDVDRDNNFGNPALHDPISDLEEAIRFADYEIALQRQITSRKEARLAAAERRLEEQLQALAGSN